MKLYFFLAATAYCASSSTMAFQSSSVVGFGGHRASNSATLTTLASSTATTAADAANTNENTSKSYLYVPSERDERYQGNIARYLLDLNELGAAFDFCGGMMFQLVLSDKLKSHLLTVVSSNNNNNDQQPIIHPASQQLMSRIPNYQKSSYADNISIFHGRELRKIPTANGGMGFVLQLSYADPSGEMTSVDSAPAGKGADVAWNGKSLDRQGWSSQEITTYDGWRSDSLRKWRTANQYNEEGWDIATEFESNEAFGLNHRCFLHLDGQDRMWLSAEDGCEGTPSEGRGGLLGKLGGMLFGN